MYTTTVALLCVSSVRSLGASLGAGLSVQEGQPTGRDQCPVPRPVLERAGGEGTPPCGWL